MAGLQVTLNRTTDSQTKFLCYTLGKQYRGGGGHKKAGYESSATNDIHIHLSLYLSLSFIFIYLYIHLYCPFYGWGSAVSRLQSHYKETVYFLPLSPQEFLVLISSTFEGRKAKSTLEPPSGFEPRPLDLKTQAHTHTHTHTHIYIYIYIYIY